MYPVALPASRRAGRACPAVALGALVARHQILRTTFGMDDGEPFHQIGLADVGLALKRGDLSAARDAETALSELACHEAQARIVWQTGPLIRGCLIRLRIDNYVLVITMHSLISDHWSQEILAEEFSALYAAASEGRANRLPLLPLQYADYAVWQRRWVGRILERQSEYWLETLAGAPTALQLLTDRPRPSEQDWGSSDVEVSVDENMTVQLKALSRRFGATLSTVLLAGWALVLGRLSGQEALLIGAPTTNRASPEIDRMAGLFVDSLALRVNLSGDPTLEHLLERVNAAMIGASEHQDLPFNQVMTLMNPPESSAHSPAFVVSLLWQNKVKNQMVLPRATLEYLGVHHCVARHGIALQLGNDGEMLRAKLIYPTTLFTVERFARYLCQALVHMTMDPRQRVWSVPLWSATETQTPPRDIPQRLELESPRNRKTGAGFDEDQNLRPESSFSAAPPVCSAQSPVNNSHPQSGTAVVKFIEGTRVVTPAELQTNNFTRYHVTEFYRQQIKNSGHYRQLKRIVEPSIKEFKSAGALDTSGEHDNTVLRGLQHKYAQTGLLLVTDLCASYCRYCFRKRIVGKDSDEVAPDFARVAQYILGHPEMTNVLLSGGDPFMLSTSNLDKCVDHLLPISHLDSIRFGTKMLAFAPDRFEDRTLLALFKRIHVAGKTAVIVTHFDHVGEISVDSERCIRSLREHGVQFLNQSVLLANINDDPEILGATFARCHTMGVRPYYLFQGRPVKGASHFQVPLRRGIEIAHGINQRLSGIQKTFKYIMSHYTGKIEILDLGADGRLYMRYHQNKVPEKIGKIFSRLHVEGSCWLDDLPE
ncbi:KamA family protein [Bradyrhizobium sp. JR1.5]|uniref:condensation domain-containing protein n=1 Tax=unclassified Bradyrhizobium TaxID=2631580 RepID=UPI00339578F2